MDYTTIPQQVRAAQWRPDHARTAGRFLGLLLEEHIRYTHLDDGSLELVGLDLVVREGEWLVVYTDGTTPELVSDADFHTRFTPARRQSEPARRGGSVTNIVNGSVDGMLLQSGGDLHFPNGLHL